MICFSWMINWWCRINLFTRQDRIRMCFFQSFVYIYFLYKLTDILAGHDINDSTTVTDDFIPTQLEDSVNVKGLRIGIPKVMHHNVVLLLLNLYLLTSTHKCHEWRVLSSMVEQFFILLKINIAFGYKVQKLVKLPTSLVLYIKACWYMSHRLWIWGS